MSLTSTNTRRRLAWWVVMHKNVPCGNYHVDATDCLLRCSVRTDTQSHVGRFRQMHGHEPPQAGSRFDTADGTIRQERGDILMRRIVAAEYLSLDGVTEDPGPAGGNASSRTAT